MTVEEAALGVEEQTTVNFPHGLGLHEAENLIIHLERDLPVYVNYTEYSSRKGGPLEDKPRDIGMTGEIISKKDNSISGRFYLNSQQNKMFEFSGLKFIKTYDKISDYKPEIIKLWEDTRKSIDDFFRPK